MLTNYLKQPVENFFKDLGLLTLATYLFLVFFAPRLSGNFRYEDILTPLLIFLILPAFSVKIFTNAIPIFAYFFYGLIITLIYIINGTLEFSAILIWGKEAQYLLIFLITLWLCTETFYKDQIYKIIKLGIFVACLYGSWATFEGNAAYYGIGYINDYSSTISSIMYFSFCVLSLIIFQRENKKIYILTAIICAFLVIMVGARTAQLALIIFFIIYFLKNNIYGMLLVLFFVISGLFVTAFSESLQSFLYNIDTGNNAFDGGISRMSTMLTPIETLKASRLDSWLLVIETGLEKSPVFGCGRGCAHINEANFDIKMPLGLGGDNQYTSNFVELGIVGSFIFLITIFLQSVRITNFRKLYFAYLVSYMASGFTIEIWQLSRGGLFFWLITALLLLESKGLKLKEPQ